MFFRVFFPVSSPTLGPTSSLMNPFTLSLFVTVRHGIDGPNRNRWFTVLENGWIFHGKLLYSHNQMVSFVAALRGAGPPQWECGDEVRLEPLVSGDHPQVTQGLYMIIPLREFKHGNGKFTIYS